VLTPPNKALVNAESGMRNKIKTSFKNEFEDSLYIRFILMEDLAVLVICAAFLKYIICETSLHLLSLVKLPSITI
jgi:hypothetical protein